ncbi:voltage-dependent anion channel [Hypoxylon trugodes]|uniref:voltage-dependent anion channel n=1 Tax=Hypoxylon trugodes TaxID=326681 RepID=UPI00219E079A|nr:voltage-dependent anion channel [Hypoxylon trugodes]KAI1382735.1 voltage-dependent anion channel [Hypoxylon trugodes]
MDRDEEVLQSANGQDEVKKIGLRDRIAHFTWANFTCTQSTGGIAILLSLTPHQFHGLQTAGVVVFVLNLVIFSLFCVMMLLRFTLHPYTFKRSFTKTPELFFFGSFWLSNATFIICMQRFGVPHAGDWIIVAIRVLFWIYAAVTLLYTTINWIVVAAKSPIDPLRIAPGVFLMIFNAMLTGTIASVIAGSQPPAQRLPILVAGIAYQGLGWIVSLMLLPWFLGTILRNGLGYPDHRPGLFMPVGSAGYTVISLIGCARYIPRGYGFFARFPIAADVLQILAVWVSIFLWLFAFWLFALAFVANAPVILPSWKRGRVPRPRMRFTLLWWGMVFPNVGLTIATIMIGEELQSDAISWVATAMTILVVGAWLMDLSLHASALITGRIMWPGKDEDGLK